MDRRPTEGRPPRRGRRARCPTRRPHRGRRGQGRAVRRIHSAGQGCAVGRRAGLRHERRATDRGARLPRPGDRAGLHRRTERQVADRDLGPARTVTERLPAGGLRARRRAAGRAAVDRRRVPPGRARGRAGGHRPRRGVRDGSRRAARRGRRRVLQRGTVVARRGPGRDVRPLDLAALARGPPAPAGTVRDRRPRLGCVRCGPAGETDAGREPPRLPQQRVAPRPRGRPARERPPVPADGRAIVCPGQAAAEASSFSIGTPTSDPYSVHDPS